MKRALALLIALLTAAILVVASGSVFGDDAYAQTLFGQDADAPVTVFVDPVTVTNSDAVVNGTVLSTVSVEVDGVPHRVSEISVDASIEGDVDGTILVEVPGGEMANGGYYFVSHTPEFVEGDQVQIALEHAAAELSTVLPFATGAATTEVFSVVGGTQGAARLTPGSDFASAIGDYALTGSAWPTFSSGVSFRVNASKVSGMPVAAATAAIQAGYQMWEDDPGSAVDFTFAGTTTASGVNLNDFQNSVSFVTPPAGANWLAQAHWISNGRGDILQFDIIVDRNRAWSVGAVPSHFDLQTTVAHEVGHGLGLGHSGASEELMYASISSGRTKALGPGDRSGLFALYPLTEVRCAGELVTVNLETGEGSPTTGRDVIQGTSGNDTIYALGGDDVICSGDGDDQVFGGAGNDIIDGGAGADRIFGGSNADTIDGGEGNDFLYGDDGWDRITAGYGNDVIEAGQGNDWVWAGPGDDKIDGGAGDDLLLGFDGTDTIIGGGGNDKANGMNGNDTVDGGNGADQLWGGLGNDYIDGDSGFDWIWGSWGSDTIKGGHGNDRLYGQGHGDSIDAGPGHDLIDGGYGPDHCNGSAGVDAAANCENLVNADVS